MKPILQTAKLTATLVFFTLALALFSFCSTIVQAASPNVVPHKPSELLVKYKPGISGLQGVSVAQQTYSTTGIFTITLTVSDGQATGITTTTATIANNAPVANIPIPVMTRAEQARVRSILNSSPGIYTIMLTVTDGMDSDSVSTTATVQ